MNREAPAGAGLPNRAARRAAARRSTSPKRRPAPDFAAGASVLIVNARRAGRLDRSQQTALGLAVHSAVDAIESSAATPQHVATVAVACNMALLLCEAGFGREFIATVKAAQAPLMRLVTAGDGPLPVLAPDEVSAVREMLDIHDAQLEHPDCTRGVVEAVLRELHRRYDGAHTLA